MNPARDDGRARHGWALKAAALLVVLALACARPRDELVSPESDGAAGTPGSPPAPGGGGPGGADGGADRSRAAPTSRRMIADPFVAVDGSRLKVRWVEAPGGARAFRGFHDSAAHVDCNFRLAADGSYRCLPEVGYGFIQDDHPDAACQGRAIRVTDASCSPSTGFAEEKVVVGCEIRKRIYRRLGPLPQTFYTTTARGTCQRQDLSPGTHLDGIGDEMPPTAWVKADAVAEPLDDHRAALEPVILEAEDGALAFLRWQRSVDQVPCTLYTSADGRQRCVEHPAYPSGNRFGDSACTQDLFGVLGPSCDGPTTVLLRRVAAPCAEGYQAYAVGPPAVTVNAKDLKDACRPATDLLPPDMADLHLPGAPLPDDTFPALDTVVDDSASSRLRRILRGSTGGRRVVVDEWFDATDGHACRESSWSGSAPVRCMASALVSVRSADFADDRCTVPVGRTVNGDCPARYMLEVSSSCPRSFVAGYAPTTVHTGPVYSKVGDAPCELGMRDAAYTYWRLMPLPEGQFAPLTAIEPPP